MARILVIDDEDLVRLTLRQMLEEAGHDVIEASNGDDGIRSYKAHSPELIIIDIIIPENDHGSDVHDILSAPLPKQLIRNLHGIETIIELQRDHPEVKIIAISGGGRTRNAGYLRLASALGVWGTLAKPFSRDQLCGIVNEALTAHRNVGVLYALA